MSFQLTKPNSGRKKSASNLMENIFMNTVSKLIYLKTDILEKRYCHVYELHIRDNISFFKYISLLFIIRDNIIFQVYQFTVADLEGFR